MRMRACSRRVTCIRPFTQGRESVRLRAAAPDDTSTPPVCTSSFARIALVSATNTLNAVRQPTIAIDWFGFVLDANPAAEALFDQHIRIKDRRLVVDDALARSCLEKLIDWVRITPDTETLPCDPIASAGKRRQALSLAFYRFTVPPVRRFSVRG